MKKGSAGRVRLHVAAFKKKQNQIKNYGKPIRDWLPIIVSLASLVVSFFTAYFSLWYEKNEVNTLVNPTSITRSFDLKLLKGNNPAGDAILSTEFYLTFMNSGTKSISINNVNFFVIYKKSGSLRINTKKELGTLCTPDDIDSEDKYSDYKYPQDSLIEPFTLKPGDIENKKIRIKESLRIENKIFTGENNSDAKVIKFCVSVLIKSSNNYSGLITTFIPVFHGFYRILPEMFAHYEDFNINNPVNIAHTNTSKW